MIGSPFNVLQHEIMRRKGRVSKKSHLGTIRCDHFLPIYKYYKCKIFTKTFKIMSNLLISIDSMPVTHLVHISHKLITL